MWSENELKFFPIKRLQLLAFRRLAAPYFQGRVADIGAGWGPYHREIPHCQIISLDMTVTPAIQVVGSALALPFRSEVWDGVVMTETLEHVPRPEVALAEAARLLRPGGLLYLTAPQMWPLHYEPHDYYRYTRYGLAHLLEAAQMEVTAIEPLGGLYTYFCTRLGEKSIKLLLGLLGWLPRPWRWPVAKALGLPGQFLLYRLSRLLDPLAPRDVLGWAVLARRKGPPEEPRPKAV